MADHDEFCHARPTIDPERCAECKQLTATRADERRRVADRVRIPRDVATSDPDPWVPLADVLALIEQGPR